MAIKGVHDLMAQNGAKRAIIDGNWIFKVVQGFLQDSSGEDDLIGLLFVMRISRPGRGEPLVWVAIGEESL